MKKYYYLVSDTSEGYQETTKYDSMQDKTDWYATHIEIIKGGIWNDNS